VALVGSDLSDGSITWGADRVEVGTIRRYREPIELVNSIEYPQPVYRLVMQAGANRDFNSIHHNSEYARATGAPEMYANTLFLQGMRERTIRDWAGSSAFIRSLRGFRMGRFNTAGSTPRVVAEVTAVGAERRLITLSVRTEDDHGVTVGPGEVDVELRSPCSVAEL
jgi:acyl dehydratase